MTPPWRLLACLLCLLPQVSARAETCRLRLLHAATDVDAVASWLDGAAWSERLEYAAFSPWRDVEAGTRNLKVTVAGGPQVLDDRDATLAAGRSYTLALLPGASDQPGPRLLLLDERPAQAEPDRAVVRFAHLALAGPATAGLTAAGLAERQPVAALARGQLTRPVPCDPVEVIGEFRCGTTVWRSPPTKLTVHTQWTFYLLGDTAAHAARPPQVLVDALEGS